MAHYIDKDALVAEIERREGLLDLDNPLGRGGMVELEYLKKTIDTLEVKEVDLDEEIDRWQGYEAFPEGVRITPLPKAMEIVERTAKYFFELGIKAQKGE